MTERSSGPACQELTLHTSHNKPNPCKIKSLKIKAFHILNVNAELHFVREVNIHAILLARCGEVPPGVVHKHLGQ